MITSGFGICSAAVAAEATQPKYPKDRPRRDFWYVGGTQQRQTSTGPSLSRTIHRPACSGRASPVV